MEEKEEFAPNNQQETKDYLTNFDQSNYPNYWMKFGMLIVFIGVGLLAAGVLSMIVLKLMIPHIGLLNMEKVLMNPQYANAAKVLQLVSTISMFLLPAVLYAFYNSRKPLDYLGFNLNISWQQIGLVFLIAWVAIYVGSMLSDLNEAIPISKGLRDQFNKAEETYKSQVLIFAKMNNIVDYFIALIVIALTPAIVEEVFFRGAMQQLFVEWFKHAWIGILLTSIIFSAIHFSYFGFLTRTSLGVILGLLYHYSKSIWLNILAHFTNNAIAVTALYVYTIKGKPQAEALEDHFPIWLGIAGSVLLVSLMLFYKKQSELQLSSKNNLTT